MDYPLCFSSAGQFAKWQELARATNHNRLDGHCADCTHEYQSQMIGAGRCSHPEVEFTIVDGMVEGYTRRAA